MRDGQRLTKRVLIGVVAAGLALAAVSVLLLYGGRSGLQLVTGAAAPEIADGALEQRVRAYLLAHPEVIVEALQQHEVRQQAAAASAARAVITARAQEILHDPDSPVAGNPKGDVTLVQFFDYNCRYCRQVAPHLAEVEASDHNLRVVYKEFPILGPGSVFAARAALAANRQGKYAALHQALMQAKDALSESSVLEAAARVGVDLDRLKRDMADPAIQAALSRNAALAQALNITGTPAFIVDDRIEGGAIAKEDMRALVQSARSKK